jgi:hypothetical protein
VVNYIIPYLVHWYPLPFLFHRDRALVETFRDVCQSTLQVLQAFGVMSQAFGPPAGPPAPMEVHRKWGGLSSLGEHGG